MREAVASNGISVGRYLGIDIGGTSTKYAMISAQGEISEVASFPTGRGCSQTDFLQRFFAVIDAAVKHGKICGIGLACLGVIDSTTGNIIGGVNNLPIINDLNFKSLLQERYPDLPVHICNDVKAAALGELWLGAGRGCGNFFCMAFGTGIGGAAVLNGKVLMGHHCRAGEIGYIDYNGQDDYYERYTSTKYVMEQAAKRLGISTITGIEFFARVRANDVVCQEVLSEWSNKIARLIANLIVVLDVEKIILGGGISPQLNLMIPLIESSLGKMLPQGWQEQTEIVAAECGNKAGMLGAVSVLVCGR